MRRGVCAQVFAATINSALCPLPDRRDGAGMASCFMESSAGGQDVVAIWRFPYRRVEPGFLGSLAFAFACVALAVAARLLLGLIGSTLYFAAFFPAVLLCTLIAGGWRACCRSRCPSSRCGGRSFRRPFRSRGFRRSTSPTSPCSSCRAFWWWCSRSITGAMCSRWRTATSSANCWSTNSNIAAGTCWR